jgi:hypothetical protein
MVHFCAPCDELRYSLDINLQSEGRKVEHLEGKNYIKTNRNSRRSEKRELQGDESSLWL